MEADQVKFLYWIYSIAALVFYGWFIMYTVRAAATPDFNIFVPYFVTFIVSFADYIGIHHITRAMFDRSIVLAIPDTLHDIVSSSPVAAIIMIIAIFVLSPILMLLCIIFHIVGMVKTLTDGGY